MRGVLVFVQSNKTTMEINHKPEGVSGWIVTGELEHKIRSNYPFFDFVLDESGALIDVLPIERPREPEPEPSASEQLRADVDYIALMAGVAL